MVRHTRTIYFFWKDRAFASTFESGKYYNIPRRKKRFASQTQLLLLNKNYLWHRLKSKTSLQLKESWFAPPSLPEYFQFHDEDSFIITACIVFILIMTKIVNMFYALMSIEVFSSAEKRTELFVKSLLFIKQHYIYHHAKEADRFNSNGQRVYYRTNC